MGHYTVRVDSIKLRGKKVMDGKFHGRRPQGRPRLRWEDNIRRDSLLLLNIRKRRRLATYRVNWRQTIWKEARAQCRLLQQWRRKRTKVCKSQDNTFHGNWYTQKARHFCNSILLECTVCREGQWKRTMPYFLIEKPILIKGQPTTSTYSYNILTHAHPEQNGFTVLTYSMEQSPSWEANWFCS